MQQDIGRQEEAIKQSRGRERRKGQMSTNQDGPIKMYKVPRGEKVKRVEVMTVNFVAAASRSESGPNKNISERCGATRSISGSFQFVSGPAAY